MASKTISFVASDDLAEWLEEESDKRMTSMSSTVQQLLAEMYRERAREEEQSDIQSDGETETVDSDDEEQTVDDEDNRYEYEILEEQSDKWYKPDSEQYQFAVRDVENRYYKTEKGLANRLKRLYG